MDIKKSQRLSQYLGIISDIVQYNDIGTQMVEHGTLSKEEHESLHTKLPLEGNTSVMNELLTMVNLRRGGFDSFLQILRNTDYIWIAEQLDPEKVFTEPSCSAAGRRGSKMQNIIENVRQSINRKSGTEMLDSTTSNQELTHLSYRGSFPIDMNLPIPPATTVASEVSGNEVTEQLVNLELGRDKIWNKVAVVENIPGALTNDATEEYFSKLARRLDIVEDLKVIRHGKVSKRRKMGKLTNVKLEFKTETERNNFIQSFEQFKTTLQPCDELYSTAKLLTISVPKVKCVGTGKVFTNTLRKSSKLPATATRSSTSNAKNAASSEKLECIMEPSKRHWYQRKLSLKSWRKKTT